MIDTMELSSSLREVIASLHKELRRQTSAVATYSMTEMETIGHLFRSSPLLPSQLAVLTRIKAQSMSQILNKFEEEGIIKKAPFKADKRKVYISLTALGKKWVDKNRYERDEWLKSSIEKSLTGTEKELLIKTLPVLRKLITDK